LRHEPGRIGATELKKLIVRVYYYLCVVALQYLAPLVLLLFLTFLLKTLGDISVLRVLGYGSPVGSTAASLNKTVAEKVAGADSAEGDIFSSAMHISRSLIAMRQVFTPACFRCLLSFFCWWICASWFTTSAFGLIYYTYFVI
jgi:Predicted transmembrane protein 161AB